VFQFGAALGATVLPLSRSYMGGYAPGVCLYAGALVVCSALFMLLSPKGPVSTAISAPALAPAHRHPAT
jgi:hypothetical protein